MTRTPGRCLAILPLALVAIALTPACAQSSKPAERAEIEKIVREYLIANPEVLEEAMVALQTKREAERAAMTVAAIKANRERLYEKPNAYFIGPADAKVTVVEFFDYRCGYCKRSVNWVTALPAAYDGKVRVVFKELPIFGGISETAALAALAAGRQGKYLEMHTGLMGIKSNDDLTDAAIDELARRVGVNVARMRADMKSEAVIAQLADQKSLGQALGVGGTPGFFIGERYIEGADIAEIEKAIAAALAS